ncbi:MAG: ABC transporter permease [Gammaproteobacteria bacterium]|nr:ABC transporter permease [Gammaproteobacteria bacterium]
MFKLPDYILPTPLAVMYTWIANFSLIWQQTQPTLAETLLGLFFGALTGIISALLLAMFKPARLWLIPVLVISQAIPTFAIAPLLVVWFGYGEASKVITATIMIFFPVTTAFYDGLRRTPLAWLDLAKTMRANRWAILWHIRIPAALPALASGLRVATALAPIGAIIGEWVGSSHGLGFLMLNANGRMQITLMFAALFSITMLSLALYYTMDWILNKTITWKM